MKAVPKTGVLKLLWVAYNRTKLSTRGGDLTVLPLFLKAFDFTLVIGYLFFDTSFPPIDIN
jgi:hypothetical protein